MSYIPAKFTKAGLRREGRWPRKKGYRRSRDCEARRSVRVYTDGDDGQKIRRFHIFLKEEERHVEAIAGATKLNYCDLPILLGIEYSVNEKFLVERGLPL